MPLMLVLSVKYMFQTFLIHGAFTAPIVVDLKRSFKLISRLSAKDTDGVMKPEEGLSLILLF